MSQLRIEATDMPEIDITRIAEGNDASVMFEALPGVKVPGRVAAILQAEEGLAAFVVVVEVEYFPEGIRPGMTAYVTVSAE
jgi:multidrug resistance efflux pump